MTSCEGVRATVTGITIFGCRLSCHLNFVARAVRKLNGLRSRRLADLSPVVTVSHAAITPNAPYTLLDEIHKGLYR